MNMEPTKEDWLKLRAMLSTIAQGMNRRMEKNPGSDSWSVPWGVLRDALGIINHDVINKMEDAPIHAGKVDRGDGLWWPIVNTYWRRNADVDGMPWLVRGECGGTIDLQSFCGTVTYTDHIVDFRENWTWCGAFRDIVHERDEALRAAYGRIQGLEDQSNRLAKEKQKVNDQRLLLEKQIKEQEATIQDYKNSTTQYNVDRLENEVSRLRTSNAGLRERVRRIKQELDD